MRNPAGWAVRALRDGWGLPVGQPASAASPSPPSGRGRDPGGRADSRQPQGGPSRTDVAESELAARWVAVVSGALDDDQLLAALEAVTRRLHELVRGSVPAVRAQLLAWAVTAHRRAPDVALPDALAAALASDEEHHPAALDGRLPEPPEGPDGPDLSARIAATLPRLRDAAGTSEPSPPTAATP